MNTGLSGDKKPEVMGKMDDSKVSTNLLEKHWSPLCVRKYQMEGWPLFVGIICDQSLSDLDKIVYEATDLFKQTRGFANDIQVIRDYTGFLSDYIRNYFDNIKRGCVEGIGIFYYIDKCAISSLWGDMMVHSSCRTEFYFIINTLPHI